MNHFERYLSERNILAMERTLHLQQHQFTMDDLKTIRIKCSPNIGINDAFRVVLERSSILSFVEALIFSRMVEWFD